MKLKNKGNFKMKRKILNPFFIILAGMLFMLPLSASTESEIADTIATAVNEITTLAKDKSINKDARYKKLDSIVTPLFDFALMSRLSLGKKQWKALDSKEKKDFTKLFTERIKHSYASKLDLYTDEQVVIEKAIRVKNRIHLPTYLVQKGEKKEVLYKLYHSKKYKKWLIYDVDILGVSILQTYRSQFAEILKKDSFSALLEKLKTTET
jgi:phospholipid transport system substrate-binding protein